MYEACLEHVPLHDKRSNMLQRRLFCRCQVLLSWAWYHRVDLCCPLGLQLLLEGIISSAPQNKNVAQIVLHCRDGQPDRTTSRTSVLSALHFATLKTSLMTLRDHATNMMNHHIDSDHCSTIRIPSGHVTPRHCLRITYIDGMYEGQ